MLLEPVVSRLVAREAVRRGWVDIPDNLAMLCTPRYAAIPSDPVYNILCTRYNRWMVSRLWGWAHLPPLYTGAVPYVHVWVDEKDAALRDPFVSLLGANWYCLGFKLHLFKYDYVETDVSLWRGSDLAPGGLSARGSLGAAAPIGFIYSICPWQAARVAADLVALNWGSAIVFSTRHRYRALDYIIARDLVASVLRACVLPISPPSPREAVIAELRLQGYIRELLSAALNPLNTYRIRREHIVTVYWLSRLMAESVGPDPWLALMYAVYGLSINRLVVRRAHPVYVL